MIKVVLTTHISARATKSFHTIEGGAIVTRNEELIEKIKLLRNHGIKSDEEVVLPGTNAKMNEFQAIMGLCNLEKIGEKIQLRKKSYEYYKQKLRDENNLKFQNIIASKYNYIYMPICFENIKKRDHVYSELLKNGIKPRKYFYPLTVNSNYFKEKGLNLVEKYNLKEAFNISNRILCLPLYPDLELSSVDNIINIIKKTVTEEP